MRTHLPLIFSIVLAIALLTTPIIALAGSHEPQDTQSVSGRATDAEPANNDISGATEMVNGEIVAGSIMVTDPNDRLDWYYIDVPAGCFFNISLGQWEYNASVPEMYNLQMLMGYEIDGDIQWMDNAWHVGPWECVSYYTPVDRIFYIVVITDLVDDEPNSLPVNYSLGAHINYPYTVERDVVLGTTMDLTWGSFADLWLKLDRIPEEDELMYFYSEFDSTLNVDMHIYQVWPYEDDFLVLINQSRNSVAGVDNSEYCEFGGSEGEYIFRLTTEEGAGNIQFVSRNFSKTRDDDNTMDGANTISDNFGQEYALDQGIDHYDWFKVDVKDGETISKVRFEITQGSWQLFKMDIRKDNGDLVDEAYNTLDGELPHEDNPLTVGITFYDIEAEYTGEYFFVIRALGTTNYVDIWEFEPANIHYSLRLTLPNNPPEVTSTIPKITINEDGNYTGLDLNTHFTDPDGHDLTFSLGRLTQNLDVEIDEDTGVATFTPEPNWFSTETVWFRATDDGPGKKFVETTVLVEVVQTNDAPEKIRGKYIDNITVYEDQMAYTPKMDSIFYDPDADSNKSLQYTITLVYQNLTPTDAVLPLPTYNASSDMFEIAPCQCVFGQAQFKITADDKNGTSKANLPSTIFNLTILHINHAPRIKSGVSDVIPITLTEGQLDESCFVWDYVEDPDIEYAGDSVEFELTGNLFLDAGITEAGCIWFDARKEFYPGQNYQEYIICTVTDSFEESVQLNYSVTINPLDDAPIISSSNPDPDLVSTIAEGQTTEYRIVVQDPDTPHKDLNYTWFRDGELQAGWNSSLFTYTTDYSSSDGMYHTLKVVVTSGIHELQVQWNITISDINRAPTGASISDPVNSTQFTVGETISFKGSGSDPDGDALEYKWFKGNEEVGSGDTFDTDELEPGIHIIRLQVSDGEYTTNSTVVFEVVREQKEEFNYEYIIWGVAAVIAVAAVAALAVSRLWRWNK